MEPVGELRSIHDLLGRLQGVKSMGKDSWSAQCPAHEDTHNSLTVSLTDDGKILCHCHKGCPFESIAGSIGLAPADFFLSGEDRPRRDRRPSTNKKDLVAIYDYGNGLEKLRYKMVDGTKTFSWRRKAEDGSITYRNVKKPGERLLYAPGGYPEPGDQVILLEGEKDVDTAVRLGGFVAVCGPDGAGPGKFKGKADYERLRDCEVFIVPDNDDPGRELANEEKDTLLPIASRVIMLDLAEIWPEIPSKGDLTDMVQALGEDEACSRLVDLMTKAHERSRPSRPSAKKISEITDDNLPPLRPAIIDGILRASSIMLLSGPSKLGKTFSLIELGLALASGRKWLGHSCRQSTVLFVDMEVSEDESSHRIQAVKDKLRIPSESISDRFIYLNCRGYDLSLDDITDLVKAEYNKNPFDVVILDPIYKLLTGDENSAGDVRAVFSKLDTICRDCSCSLVFSHHHSKGSQGGKSAMDRNSGSGVWARSPDALVDMIELEVTDGAKETIFDLYDLDRSIPVIGLRIEYVLRSFKTPDPETAFFCYPIHVMDRTGILEDARTMRSVIAMNDRNPSKLTWEQAHDIAYEKCRDMTENEFVSFDAFSLAVIATGKSRSQDSVYKSLKDSKSAYEYVRKKGDVPAHIVPKF